MASSPINARDYLQVKCSWTCNCENMDACDTVSLKLIDDQNEPEVCLKDYVSVDNSANFILCKPGNHSPPSIRVNVSNDKAFSLSYIVVASEAKMVELFTDGDYIETQRGENIFTMEKTEALESRFICPPGTSSMMLKFLGLKRKDFWVYGIHVTLEKKTKASTSRINYEHVERLVHDSKMPEKGKSCMAFVKHYIDKESNKNAMDVENLNKLLTATALSQNNGSPEPRHEDSNGNLEELKKYVDEALGKFNEQLLAHKEEINCKLDYIIGILSDKHI